MQIKIQAYARFREIVGEDEVVLDMPEGATAGEVIARLVDDYPDLEQYRDAILISVNREYTARSDMLSDGDICVIFPPVSGG
jgi:molybdopterin synthase catalytic subunit